MLLVAAGLSCLTMSSQAGLLAHYKIDEPSAATVAVDELGGTSGAIGSTVTIGVAGISGNAYSLPDIATGQTGIVDMGDASFFAGTTGLNASTQLTDPVWMNSTDSDPDRNTILNSGSSTVSNSYQNLGICGQTDVPTNAVGQHPKPPGLGKFHSTNRRL